MIFINLLGDIAILLWSTRMVRLGVSRYMGSRLPEMVGRATKNRMRASLTGMVIAGMLQSASATSILASSFAKQGAISVTMGLAILLGADVGSTIMVQILTFDVRWFAPIAFLFGYIIFVRGKEARTSELGRAFMGVGLIILSLQMMTSTMTPLRNDVAFVGIINTLTEQKLLAFVIVAFATWFMHSSIAMILIIIGLVTGGTISLEFGLLITLGTNIGASVIPLVLNLKSSPEAKSIPFGGLLMRSLAVIVVIPFLSVLSGAFQQYVGNDGFSVALFHTGFNVLILILGLPFVGAIAKFCKRVFPSRRVRKPMGAKGLKKEYLTVPEKALSMAEKEISVQAEYVEEMLSAVIQIIKKDDYKRIEKISKIDDYIDALYEDIKMYTTKITSSKMTDDEARRATNIITYTTNLEYAGDIIEKHILDMVGKKIQNNIVFSNAGWTEIKSIHVALMEQMRLSILVFSKGRVEDARQLLRGKEHLQSLEHQARELHFERLRDGVDASLNSSALHLDLVQDFKLINAHLCSIAYPILEKHGALYSSRLK